MILVQSTDERSIGKPFLNPIFQPIFQPTIGTTAVGIAVATTTITVGGHPRLLARLGGGRGLEAGQDDRVDGGEDVRLVVLLPVELGGLLQAFEAEGAQVRAVGGVLAVHL